MDENYLIPANSKKSMLILGFFTAVDLIIFVMGIAFTLLMFITVQANKLYILFLILSPALISTFLVLPVPYYHNVIQLIKNIYEYYTKRRRFYWKGWCVTYEEDK